MTGRRQFLSAGLIGLTAKADRPIAGSFVNESHVTGHRLRDRARFSAPRETRQTRIAIVGGGIAGLSAAWWLARKGFRDFVVLDAEPEAGGNSRYGENEITRYPWAAHYVPFPNAESTYVRDLFTELGLLDAQGHGNERWLCHSPQERLFLHGRWQPGLDPELALTAADRAQFRRFEELIAAQRATKRYTIPLELGRRPDPLERISARAWLDQHQFTSPYLRWHVDYACRDDYGSSLDDANAWAAIHYFAAREHEERGPFTWPEGNGWILRRLLDKLAPQVETNSLVHRITPNGRRWRVDTERLSLDAAAVIFAAPTFLAPYLIEGFSSPVPFEYSPWLTANLTIENAPDLGETAWDNVIYQSPSLGYVVATHQNVSSIQHRSVWTYYWALTGDPLTQRRRLLSQPWTYWRDLILADLAKAHPRIRDHVSRIDIMRLGHAMRRPILKRGEDPVFDRPGLTFANSDLSGCSLFEEAQYHGIQAALRILPRVS